MAVTAMLASITALSLLRTLHAFQPSPDSCIWSPGRREFGIAHPQIDLAPLAAASSGGELFESDEESGGGADDPFFASLRARREELRSRSIEIRNRWVGAKCESAVRLALDDWVRRLDLRRWPLVALGSARGSIYVADLERGEVIACAEDAHSQMGGNPNGNIYLFGEFDGGGTLAIAVKGDSVVSAGREGGAKAWRLDAEGGELVPLGELSALGKSIVTSLKIDEEGKLWVATYDGTFEGTVHRFDLLEKTPLSEQEPLKVKLSSGVLTLAVSDEVALVAAGTVGGTVELISTEDGSTVGSWDVHNGPTTHIRAVEIFHAGVMEENESKNNKWCIVCGGGDGSMKMRWLNTHEGEIVTSAPFDEERLPNVLPPHSGMVVSLTGCRKNGAGMLVSGAQDGTLRVWDFSDDPLSEGDEYSSEYDAGADTEADPEFQPVVLYQLVGYKVWLGSVCVDEEGLRLISDGADNTVVVHDFSSEVHG